VGKAASVADGVGKAPSVAGGVGKVVFWWVGGKAGILGFEWVLFLLVAHSGPLSHQSCVSIACNKADLIYKKM